MNEIKTLKALLFLLLSALSNKGSLTDGKPGDGSDAEGGGGNGHHEGGGRLGHVIVDVRESQAELRRETHAEDERPQRIQRVRNRVIVVLGKGGGK